MFAEMWIIFFIIIIVLLSLDLGFFHRKQKVIGTKESLLMSLIYFLIGIMFGIFVWLKINPESGKQYFAGFIIEKSLSLDNLFLISAVFSFFGIKSQYQHKVLFWGVLGVIILRAIMIALGCQLVEQFAWLIYVFGVFLIITGIKLFLHSNENQNIDDNSILKYINKHFRTTKTDFKEKFFVKLKDENTGKMKLWVTPLFASLVSIEVIDFIFAVDSVPAILIITTDPYIIYTSNIFAILGLRSLYFALANMIEKFKYLKKTLAAILVFIGSKVFIARILGMKHFPIDISLGITIGLLFVGIVSSIGKKTKS